MMTVSRRERKWIWDWFGCRGEEGGESSEQYESNKAKEKKSRMVGEQRKARSKRSRSEEKRGKKKKKQDNNKQEQEVEEGRKRRNGRRLVGRPRITFNVRVRVRVSWCEYTPCKCCSVVFLWSNRVR